MKPINAHFFVQLAESSWSKLTETVVVTVAPASEGNVSRSVLEESEFHQLASLTRARTVVLGLC